MEKGIKSPDELRGGNWIKMVKFHGAFPITTYIKFYERENSLEEQLQNSSIKNILDGVSPGSISYVDNSEVKKYYFNLLKQFEKEIKKYKKILSEFE